MDKEEQTLSPLQGMFYWWGRLTAHRSPRGSFPARASHFLAFIAPKVRHMGFGIDQQSDMISSFLKGVYKIFRAEAKAQLDLNEDDE